MRAPKVSVVMPVYNGEAYLREAIESILFQTYQDFELLVIDDGSTDGTAAILQEFAADERVKVLCNASNTGLIYTRNKGVANSQGEYIAILDSDDIAMPNRLEQQVAFLDANPEFVMVGSSIDLIDSEGNFIRKQHYPAPSKFIPSLLLFQNNFAQSAVMLRKACLPAPCYREGYEQVEDYDLWIRLANSYKVANLPQTLVKYRHHQSSISNAKATVHTDRIKKVLANQLQNIGITPTATELDLHYRIGILQTEKSMEALNEAEKWLMKVRSANSTSGYYSTAHFNTIVAQKWYEVCKSSRLGLQAYKKMLSSSLFKLDFVTYMLRTKLFSQLFAQYGK